MTQTLDQPVTTVLDFKNWLKNFTTAELSNGEAAKLYVAELISASDIAGLAYLATQHLVQVATTTTRAKAKIKERESYGAIKPTVKQKKMEDIFDYVREKEFNIPTAPSRSSTNGPVTTRQGTPIAPRPVRKTSAQKNEEAMAHRKNMKALLRARIDIDAETMQPNIDLTSGLLDSSVVVNGKTTKYRDLTYETAEVRFDSLFSATSGDYEGLVYLRAIMRILQAFPGKTLEQIAEQLG